MDNKKNRLNLYISPELLSRLEFCASRYGVSRAQMAVMLIGQGVAGIEEAFEISKKIANDKISNIDSQKTFWEFLAVLPETREVFGVTI